MSLHPNEIVEAGRPEMSLLRLGPAPIGTSRVDISQNEMRFRGQMGMIIDMKRVACCSPLCGSKPINHENLSPRGAQFFWVREESTGPWYCSRECSKWKEEEPKEVREGKERMDLMCLPVS